MELTLYIIGIIAIITAINVILQNNLMYSLLYFMVSLLSVSCIFFLLNFCFIGALTIIIYTGSIMILFIFVIMTTNIKKKPKKIWKNYKNWIKLLLPILFIYIITYNLLHEQERNLMTYNEAINEKDIGYALFGESYFIIVELASIMLLASLVITLHISQNLINKK
ncbi:MAG: NADH:quinone oxidoreductase subunit J [Candidatus Westeberhardia cardiocondylae]|nr:NADH:quinone oxidoreductase subunit J [Candidatus Westeberhardia cardiocondylae]